MYEHKLNVQVWQKEVTCERWKQQKAKTANLALRLGNCGSLVTTFVREIHDDIS